MSARITQDLESQVDSSDGNDIVDVVIELLRDEATQSGLTPTDLTRGEAMKALKAWFEEICSAVEKEIQETGGTVVDRAWINRTIRARLPAKAIAELANRHEVAVIDVPHKIERERT